MGVRRAFDVSGASPDRDTVSDMLLRCIGLRIILALYGWRFLESPLRRGSRERIVKDAVQ